LPWRSIVLVSIVLNCAGLKMDPRFRPMQPVKMRGHCPVHPRQLPPESHRFSIAGEEKP